MQVLKYVHWKICDELLFRNAGAQPVFVVIPLQALPSPTTRVNDQVNVCAKTEPRSRSRRALQNARTACRAVTLAGGKRSQLVQNLLKSRTGHPLKSHNCAQCEACQWGVCTALSAQEAQRSKHRFDRSRRRRRERHARSTTGQNGKPPEPSPEQPTSSRVQSLKSESETSRAEPLKKPDMRRNIHCLQMTCSDNVFGSARGADSKRGITFRSLRHEKDEVTEKLKGWKSADSIPEATDAFDRLNINV
ncbi:unnamed protein product [Schistocephalus solidus]|uniref:Uncharacterized protein n=1 Tax=Schistocephalus solidus TaxID=70667 RepID=A0A183SGN4_SCHSO|nr:unnamed protein product [Schistocephalus solidus]